MADEVRHMVIGLQSSGKTTFAAALWYLVDSNQVATALKRGKHTGEFAYLEELAAEWADCWRVPRTGSKRHENIAMNLEDTETGVEVVLQFVDLPGEAFERAFATRVVGQKVADAFKDVSGLMLFVNAAQPRDDVTLLDLAKFLEENTDEDNLTDERAVDALFDPAKTPRQVQLVDFLQAVQDSPMDVFAPRVVVIISAWDKAASNAKPEAWLKEKMPLLSQYLENMEAEVRVYGVSAQGGELPEKNVQGNDFDRKTLLQVNKASERIIVVGNGAGIHDLTHPVRWLSGLAGV